MIWCLNARALRSVNIGTNKSSTPLEKYVARTKLISSREGYLAVGKRAARGMGTALGIYRVAVHDIMHSISHNIWYIKLKRLEVLLRPLDPENKDNLHDGALPLIWVYLNNFRVHVNYDGVHYRPGVNLGVVSHLQSDRRLTPTN